MEKREGKTKVKNIINDGEKSEKRVKKRKARRCK